MDDPHYTAQMDAPVDFPPRRVVSLVPSLTESLFDLGLGDRLVAVTDHCVYPEGDVERLPKVGVGDHPDIRGIADLSPDLVIVNADESGNDAIAALQAAGLTVWATRPRTVREVFNLLWNIMHLFDTPDMVERIRSVEWVADWLEKMAAQRETPCRVFAATATAPLTTVNADTYMHDLICVCGGTNVFADRAERHPRVTPEDIAASQPNVILLPDTLDDQSSILLDSIARLDLPATIRRVDVTLLTWPGTRIARALSELPGLICPQEDTNS